MFHHQQEYGMSELESDPHPVLQPLPQGLLSHTPMFSKIVELLCDANLRWSTYQARVPVALGYHLRFPELLKVLEQLLRPVLKGQALPKKHMREQHFRTPHPDERTVVIFLSPAKSSRTPLRAPSFSCPPMPGGSDPGHDRPRTPDSTTCMGCEWFCVGDPPPVSASLPPQRPRYPLALTSIRPLAQLDMLLLRHHSFSSSSLWPLPIQWAYKEGIPKGSCFPCPGNPVVLGLNASTSNLETLVSWYKAVPCPIS